MFGLPLSVIFLSLGSLFTDIASDSVYPILPIYLATVLGATPFSLGLIEGVAESTASVLKFFSGWLSDHLPKKKPIVLFGYSLSTISKPLLGLVGSWPQALGVRFLDRLGKGIRTAPRDAWLAKTTEESLYAKVYGFHRAMDHTGAVIGPALATVYLAWRFEDYRGLFLLTLFPGLIALVFLLLAKEVPEPKTLAIPKEKPRTSWEGLPPILRKYFLCLTVFSLGNSSDAFLILRLKDAGIATEVIPISWALLHVVKMLSSLASPAILKKLGTRATLLIGWGIYIMVYVLFPFCEDHAVLTALFLIYGLFFGLTEAPERALIAKSTSATSRGSAFGLYNMAIGLSILPASLVFGALWKTVGMTSAFMFSAALSAVAALALLLIRNFPE